MLGQKAYPSSIFSKKTTFRTLGMRKKEKKLRRLRRPLTPEEKSLAIKLVQSEKSRRDLLEWNFHRYRFFEEDADLPDWFVNDEKKHMRKAPLLEDVSSTFYTLTIQSSISPRRYATYEHLIT